MFARSSAVVAAAAAVAVLVATPHASADVASRQQARVAEAYLAVWTVDGKPACEARTPACEGMDAILSRAAKALEAAGKNADAITTYETLRDPRYHLESTPAGHEAALAIAELALTRGAFETAASWLERFDLEQRGPVSEEGARAMARAVSLRLLLGQLTMAQDDEARLESTYRERAALPVVVGATVAIAEHLLAHGDAEGARALVQARIVSDAARAPVASRVALYTRLARALRALGRGEEARRAYETVIAEARRTGPWPTPRRTDQVRRHPLLTPRTPEWTPSALDDAAEALFETADARRRATAVPIPGYSGAGDRESILGFTNEKVQPWVQYEESRIAALEVRFAWVLGMDDPPVAEPPPPRPPRPDPLIGGGMIGLLDTGLGGDPNAPTAPWGRDEDEATWSVLTTRPPSPRWAIRASAGVAAMWSDLGDAFRRLPVPRWEHSPEVEDLLRGVKYVSSLPPVSDGFREKAASAYSQCLDLSTRYRLWDETSRECEAWLVNNRKADHPTNDTTLIALLVHHDDAADPLQLPP